MITLISVFLILIQSVALLSVVMSIILSGNRVSHYILSSSNEYQLAAGDNIIILMADSISRDDFEAVYNSHPEMLEQFSDFTWYKKANNGEVYATFPSMMHMLTTTDVDNSVSNLEWCEKAWNSENTVNFFEELYACGYTCNIYAGEQTYIWQCG